MGNANFEKLIDADELCELCGFRKSFVYSLTHQKKIPHYKVGHMLRFKLSEIFTWLDKKMVSVAEDMKIVDF